MALTFTIKIANALRAFKQEALLEAEVDMTTSTGSNGADYSSGFNITGNASKMGMHKVFEVIGAVARQSNGTLIPLIEQWDVNTGKLRFYSATNTEITTDIPANGIVRMLVRGC